MLAVALPGACSTHTLPLATTASPLERPVLPRAFLANVQDCELFSLRNLNTGSATARQKIADFLLMLAQKQGIYRDQSVDVVSSGGSVTLTLPAISALAIDLTTKLP